MSMARDLSTWFPILRWSRGYGRPQFMGDLTAAAVVTLLLIPQSLAYALLAGLPAVTGLYASMLPLEEDAGEIPNDVDPINETRSTGQGVSHVN